MAGRERCKRRNRGRCRPATALNLLEALAKSDGVSLSALAKHADLAPSSAYRLLQTLAARGYVEFLERDQLWRSASRRSAPAWLSSGAAPFARGSAARRASGIGKALLAEMPRRAVDKVIADKGLTIVEGSQLYADLARTHVRGWALDDEERNAGMRCIAAIFNEFGDPVAGLSISGPVARIDDSKVAALGPLVMPGAAEITRLVGGVSLPRAGAT